MTGRLIFIPLLFGLGLPLACDASRDGTSSDSRKQAIPIRVWHTMGESTYRFESLHDPVGPKTLFTYDFGDASDYDMGWRGEHGYIDSGATMIRADVGYIFFQDAYAVTTDAGAHWSLTRFSKLLSSEQSIVAMTRLNLHLDGTGIAEAYVACVIPSSQRDLSKPPATADQIPVIIFKT